MAQPGEEILSSDIGEGTLATPFMRQCVSRCLPGEGSWKNVRRRNIRLPGGLLNKQPLHLCFPRVVRTQQRMCAVYSTTASCARNTCVVQGTLTLAVLPEYAFTWTTNASTPCAFECKLQYTRTGAAAQVPTFVLCSGTCEKGPSTKKKYYNRDKGQPGRSGEIRLKTQFQVQSRHTHTSGILLRSEPCKCFK